MAFVMTIKLSEMGIQVIIKDVQYQLKQVVDDH
jgi:hypothetical protein